MSKNTQEFEGNDFDKKRKTEMSIDRLSALPDCILIHILSFLGGVEESAVTSVLSKRWRFIWAELPSLDFYEYSKESEKRREFVSKVNRTLLIRAGAGIHLEKFYVLFWYNESFASDVDSWVDFVLKHKVEKVGLQLYAEGIAVELYALPETMYSNSSLTHFAVERCLMDTSTKIEWPSLNFLCIEDSKWPQHVVESIFSGCPVLHTLDLIDCWGFRCLDAKSQNLCKLRVKDRNDGSNGDLLEIAAPYVHTLDLSFFSQGRKLVLRNIKSLVRVHIDFVECRSTSDDVVLSTTMELFKILKDVKEFRLGKGYLKVHKSLVGAEIEFLECWNTSYDVVLSTTKELFEILKDVNRLIVGEAYLKVLSELVVNGWQLPVSRLKSLTVPFMFIGFVSGVYALLKFSPNLERLAICCINHREGETWDEAPQVDVDFDLLHLKMVEILDLGDPTFGFELMLRVAQTLLMRAKVLEEMKITYRVEERSDKNKIGQTLLNYPRSSEKAVVRLHQL